LRVLIQDMRALEFCSRGGRAFARRHGFSWSDFVARGIEAETLEATGDAMALRLIEKARDRERWDQAQNR